MEITENLLTELQNRLKVGSKRGVHLNAIPGRSRYKFDLTRLSYIDEKLPNNFIYSLLTEQPLKFKISWKDNVPDLNSLFEEDQVQLVKITKSFENLINQTAAIESEKGINTFGFGFPLLIRRDQLDNKLTVAPILIWSLRIKRSKEFNTWVINRNEDDPIYINEVLINHLQNDSKIKLDKLPSDFLDDGLIDRKELIDICVNIIKTINSAPTKDLRKKFKEKLSNIVPISNKTHYEQLPLTSNNSFIEFGGLFSIFEVQKQNIIHDYEELIDQGAASIDLDKMEKHFFQPISSIETDPSQQGILHSLQNTRNILIQGPPGTGKSQSLTAILVNALENHKKTIVVCEKRTALEVLYNSLNNKGLNYQCVLIKDIVKDRRTVVNSVRDRVDRLSHYENVDFISKENLDGIVNKATTLINSINKKHKKLGRKLIGSKNWTNIVGELLSELKDNQEDYNLELNKELFKYQLKELNKYIEVIKKGKLLYNDFQPYRNKTFLNPEKLIGDNPYKIEQEINKTFVGYVKNLKTIKNDIISFHNDYFDLRKKEVLDKVETIKKTNFEIDKIYQQIDEEINQIRRSYYDLRQKDFSNQLNLIGADFDLIKSIYEKRTSDVLFLDTKRIKSFGIKFKSIFSSTLKDLINDCKIVESKILKIETSLYQCNDLENVSFGKSLKSKKQNFFKFLDYLKNEKENFNQKIRTEFSLLKLDDFIYDKINNQKCCKGIEIKIDSSTEETHMKFYSETLGRLTNIQNNIIEKQNELLEFIIKSNDFSPIHLSDTLSERQVEIKKSIEQIKVSLDEIDSKIMKEIESIDVLQHIDEKLKTKHFYNAINGLNNLKEKINQDGWIKKKLNFKKEKDLIKAIEEIIRKKEEYFSNDEDLFSIEFKWFQFYNSISDVEKTIIDQLLEKDNWEKVFLLFYMDSMLVKYADTNLPTNDNEHKELDDTLSKLEKKQLKYVKEYWYSKQNNATKDFQFEHTNLTVENLYNKRAGKKHKRLSLRQIVEFDIELFTTFFPIILTTPDVCSNLFKGNNKYFDIVMFDEASQLKLEDNFPALLKGKQIIIAGDEHQMPPSNYFSKIFDGSIEDEDELEDESEEKIFENGLLSAESLLEFAEELNFKKKYLDFHYRSRHPYLIDFSNYAFYNQRLKPLPNSFEYTPIKYIQVNGTYSDHTNEAEAETVLSIIENNINRLPNRKYPSVGIATFNIHQRNLIISKINERRKFKKYSDFNEKIIELEDNGLFVKNLENIQGDERDVIILTTTYGMNKDGKFAQRFGSINHQKGYKLLNVIITRAKYKVYVCSSVPKEVFLNYKEHLLIEGANNRRAVFFAYLAYAKAVSENDEEQRLTILNTLAENTKQSSSVDILNEDLESPFEEEVYQALTKYFDKSKIIPQFKFAGFRIDLVYDSKIKGIPKIAIECDGASYHSSREAYLYDRHRQKILEKHGFIFHRIWSTNWWRNPKREINKLVRFIKSIEKRKPSITKNKSRISLAFTDNIEINTVNQTVPDTQELKETVQAISEKEVIQTELFKDVIKIGSKVKIKYLNMNKDITIKIVENKVNKYEKLNGVQKVHIKSPLATAILGKEAGETAKVGNLDNYVEILELIN